MNFIHLMNFKRDYPNSLKLSKILICKTTIILLLICSGIHAQTELDTLSGVQLSDTSFVMEKSPWGAVLRSALISGFGQVYNESYWKAPVIWGFIGYFTYGWISNNDLYKKYRDRYSSSLASSDLSLREFYKDSRDL